MVFSIKSVQKIEQNLAYMDFAKIFTLLLWISIIVTVYKAYYINMYILILPLLYNHGII